MIKQMYLKLPHNLKKYIIVSLSLTLFVSIFVFAFSLSFLAFLLINAIGIAFTLLLSVIDKLRKSTKKALRVVSLSTAILIIIFSCFTFFESLKELSPLASVFTRESKVETSSELLNLKNRNVKIEINPDSVFETDFKVEKVISQKDDESGTVSSVWDGDEWIDSIILDREVLYVYCVFLYGEDYFVGKFSKEAFDSLSDLKEERFLSAYAAVPAGAEINLCNSICEDINKIIYNVDHFEGETNDDFYSDLEKVEGINSVVVVFETRNLLFERTVISVSFIAFVSSVIYFMLSILISNKKE